VLIRIEIGYPRPGAEREPLKRGDRREHLEEFAGVVGLKRLLLATAEGARVKRGDRRELLEQLPAIVDRKRLVQIQAEVDGVKAADPLIDYVQRLVHFSRHEQEFAFGLSPRGALALLRSARAWALLHRRRHVVPEDVQAVLPSVVEHRLRSAADFSGHGGGALAQKLLSGVDVVGCSAAVRARRNA